MAKAANDNVVELPAKEEKSPEVRIEDRERRAEEILAGLSDDDRASVEWLLNCRCEDEIHEGEMRDHIAESSVTLVPGYPAAQVLFTANELRHLQTMVRGGWGADPAMKRWQEILASKGIDENAWHRVMYKVDAGANAIAAAAHFVQYGPSDSDD